MKLELARNLVASVALLFFVLGNVRAEDRSETPSHEESTSCYRSDVEFSQDDEQSKIMHEAMQKLRPRTILNGNHHEFKNR